MEVSNGPAYFCLEGDDRSGYPRILGYRSLFPVALGKEGWRRGVIEKLEQDFVRQFNETRPESTPVPRTRDSVGGLS